MYNCRLFLITIFLSLFAFKCVAQTSFSQNTYWVYLTDKQFSKYTIEIPQDFLSSKAIDRRLRNNIAINQTDLPVSSFYVSQIEALGANIITKSRWLNALSITVSNPEILDQIKELPFVKSVQVVKKYKSIKEDILMHHDDLRFEYKTDLSNYGLAGNQFGMIEGPYLHDKGFTGEGMVIAVFDAGFTGVDTGIGFSSVWSKDQILGVWNFADNNDSVFISSYHGTWVLSIMAGDIPGTYIGAAPDAEYYLFRTEVSDSEYIAEEHFWLAAAEQADFLGVDIINSSLSYTTFDVSENDHTYADLDGNTTIITKAADMAASKGILVCSSAGNYAQDSWKYIGAPADGDSVFSIGAVDGERLYAPFSSVGPTSDGRIKPDISVQGMNSTVLSPEGIVYVGSGTSFSSPLAAGASAILWQANPDKSNMEIIQAMKKSASQFQHPDNKLGWGIPNLIIADMYLKGFAGQQDAELFTAFANPSGGNLYLVIYAPVENNARVELYDLSGKLVMEYKPEFSDAGINPLIISGLPEYVAGGMYLLTVKTGDRVETKRIALF